MQHITITPFGRPVSAALMAARAQASTPAEGRLVPKWQVLRDLTGARAAFGLKDRDLAVLQALLSFLPDDEIADDVAIVFPSNARLCARAHGMAESSLRRHLAVLVGAGLVLRHDSPNGKRYAARDAGGAVTRAFGFDLAPLARRADEIAMAAAEAQAAADGLRRLREEAVLALRDAAALVGLGLEAGSGLWDDLADAVTLLKRRLRRRLEAAALAELRDGAVEILGAAKARFTAKTGNPGANDADSERHIQNSNRLSSESELSRKRENVEVVAESPDDGRADAGATEAAAPVDPVLPLHLVLRACPDLLDYAPHGILHWHQLVATAATVRAFMGISADAWDEACRIMGPGEAAVVVACLLQRAERIARPGGYLRALSARHAQGSFSTGPMVMALLRAEDARAA